jgi:hypothetical protein
MAPTPGVAPTPGLDGGYGPAPTPGGHHGPAPTPGGPLGAPTPGEGGGYYSAPTPGGAGPAPTPGGPGGVAYTPGGYAATPGAMLAATPGGPMAAATPGGPLGEPGGGGGGDGEGMPDYSGVLVKLPGGGVGVARGWLPGVVLEVEPLGGGPPVPVEIIELVQPARQDLVKVVGGPTQGATGRLISIEGADAVLADGTLAELSLIGKLAEAAG